MDQSNYSIFGSFGGRDGFNPPPPYSAPPPANGSYHTIPVIASNLSSSGEPRVESGDQTKYARTSYGEKEKEDESFGPDKSNSIKPKT